MNGEQTLWDRSGNPVFFLVNDWLLDLQGQPVGFIETDGAVYDLKGRHVAWFTGGIIRDRSGYCVAFGDVIEERVYPPLPTQQQPPKFTPKLTPSIHPLTSVPSLPPLPRSSWSNLRPYEIFAH